ncbi:hypothetical protein KP003_15165 [Geomonas nitrogeniifigens]|uniref:Uncharacterized protein n=1 Tax=Geomonas diazotrophica TaxID=2843197 RepID=A0ABX8JHH4_9BACT|nr:hypothetical protein [Geomonas nitrogeniifigens]QWV96601.1 hypothetical protein KP005_14685 [Geomonas nitrogeniifigens]QXE85703.1 hypothetical protein KP003_15165 [Geomonas nitrogeniifigens]
MGVLVCYDDFTYDVINDYFLDYLLSTGCIIGFDRSEHWMKKEEAPLPATLQQRHTSA